MDEQMQRRGVAALLRRHWPMAALLGAAAALRIVAVVAIYPGIWFSDSNEYIRTSATGTLSLTRPDGYALFVAPFWHAGSAGALIVTQHVIGLAIVVVLYVLLVRQGVPRWLALLGVVPAALDVYLIVVEHAIMSETIFHAAVVGTFALLLFNERPALAACAVAGVLLGYAGVVRSVAVPFIAIFVVWMLVRRMGWRRLAVFCAGWVIVPLGYAAAFDHQHGTFGFSESDGRFLYGKVAVFADCSKLGDLPADERALCPDPRRRLTPTEYQWGGDSPIHGLGPGDDPRMRDFSLRVIGHQPLDYGRVVAEGFFHYFRSGHHIGRNDYPVAPWQFPADPRVWGYPGYRGPIRRGDPERSRHHPITEPNEYVGSMVAHWRVDVGASRFMHDLQRHLYAPGPLLAACVLIVVLALVLRRGATRPRADAALMCATALLSLLVAQALSVFSYRYGVGAIILLPPAAALAGTTLLPVRREARAPAVVVGPTRELETS